MKRTVFVIVLLVIAIGLAGCHSANAVVRLGQHDDVPMTATKQSKPVYPFVARRARVQGTVKIEAVVGKDGKIKEAKVISGHRLLAPSALKAVKTWKYEPVYLNKERVEVKIEVEVAFVLQ